MHHNINVVGGALNEHHVINVACGDSFTVCATQENHVFSWGSAKDGRLGLDFALNRPDTNIVSSPRPIFGSLYLVSDMCSRFWNSIIIAEKIIDAKAVRSMSHNNRSLISTACSSTAQINSISDSDYATMDKRENNINACEAIAIDEQPIITRPSIFDNIPQCSQIARSIATDNMPEWLKNELEDAEFIPFRPLDGGENIIKNEITSNNDSPTKSLAQNISDTLVSIFS